MSQVVNTIKTFHSDHWELKCLSAPCELWKPLSAQLPNGSWLNLVEFLSYASAFCTQRLMGAFYRFLAFSPSFPHLQNSTLHLQLPPWPLICLLNPARPLWTAGDSSPCTESGTDLLAEPGQSQRSPRALTWSQGWQSCKANCPMSENSCSIFVYSKYQQKQLTVYH